MPRLPEDPRPTPLAAAAATPSSPRRTWHARVRTFGPWIVAAAAVAAILAKYPASEIADGVRRGHAAPLVPIALGLSLVLLVLVSTWDGIVLRAVLGRPRWRDVVRGKAGSAVLMALGYAFGSGAYGVWIARTTGTGPKLAAGVVLYLVASDLGAVCLVATGSVWVAGVPAPAALRIGAPAVAAILAALVVAGPFVRVRRSPPGVLHPWRTVPRASGLLQMAGRTANIVLASVATWAGARAFGLSIPLSAMVTYMPVVLLVGSLPVNVAGFGAVQGAWLLFTDWAPGPAILAFQLLWQLAMGAAVVVRGLPFVRRVVAEIDEGRR